MAQGPSGYYDRDLIAARVARGDHRQIIGGLWDELGALQLNFLRANGLTPQSKLLDIGCGSLRLGVRAVDYLEPGRYWGTDLNEVLLTAGYEKEIVPAGLAHKLPRSNLIVDGDFAFPNLPRDFDVVVAQSVFTHLPFNHMRLCLARLAEHMKRPCTFFITAFVVPDALVAAPFTHQPGGVTTQPHHDPYHYAVGDFLHAANGLPWKVDYIGEWNHPRSQKMVAFRIE